MSIDYGLGRTNIDHATGIRYGCISGHSIMAEWTEVFDVDYGEPTCPRCIGPVVEYDDTLHGECEIGHLFSNYSHISSADYVCETCKHLLASEECYSEEPYGYTLDDKEYLATTCLDSDILIAKSPYYTYAPFCSPCVPGAGNLDGISTTRIDANSGVKTYCFNHDWFDNNTAPYRVFRVSDDTEVFPHD